MITAEARRKEMINRAIDQPINDQGEKVFAISSQLSAFSSSSDKGSG
jgi:hypothetical protein